MAKRCHQRIGDVNTMRYLTVEGKHIGLTAPVTKPRCYAPSILKGEVTGFQENI